MRDRGIVPGLAVVLVGEDPASQVYVRSKGRACEEAGMHSVTVRLPADASEAAVLAQVDQLNADPAIHGFLVQLPLPGHIDRERSSRRIDPPRMWTASIRSTSASWSWAIRAALKPATPSGVQEMLLRDGIETRGRTRWSWAAR